MIKNKVREHILFLMEIFMKFIFNLREIFLMILLMDMDN
jgi:hypothetical protein